jgi:thymidylate synthase ThyX
MAQHLIRITPKPAEMKQEAYERTLKARAFDITRYLLPLATNTSLGEIVNARTLETQVAHLLVAYAQRSAAAGRVAEEGGDVLQLTT